MLLLTVNQKLKYLKAVSWATFNITEVTIMGLWSSSKVYSGFQWNGSLF